MSLRNIWMVLCIKTYILKDLKYFALKQSVFKTKRFRSLFKILFKDSTGKKINLEIEKGCNIFFYMISKSHLVEERTRSCLMMLHDSNEEKITQGSIRWAGHLRMRLGRNLWRCAWCAWRCLFMPEGTRCSSLLGGIIKCLDSLAKPHTLFCIKF